MKKYNPSIGYDWKRKKNKKAKGGSQTPGKTKGGSCVASSLDRYMATRNRSYKHPLYGEWTKRKNGMNKK